MDRRPDFERPPVIEVVCGVQFRAIPTWTTACYGLYWARIRDQYPDTEDRPPLPRQFPDSAQAPVELETPLLPPLRRAFYITRPPNYLVQLQANRFLHNWRKVSEGDQYPRYEDAFKRFSTRWGDFQEFVRELGAGPLQPEMYELTYINHIAAPDATFPRDVWKFLSFYNENPLSDPEFEPSGLRIHFAWPLKGGSGSLLMDVRHGRRLPDESEILSVEFTARGPAGAHIQMFEWFDVAHDAIVNSFSKLTTEQAHQFWGKRP